MAIISVCSTPTPRRVMPIIDGPECYITSARLTSSTLRMILAFMQENQRNTTHKNSTQTAKQVFTFSERSVCQDECCMIMRQQKLNLFVN